MRNTLHKTIAIGLLRLTITAITLLTVGTAVLVAVPGARGIPLALLGYGHGCGLRETWGGGTYTARVAAERSAQFRNARTIKRDGRLVLFDAPGGKYWIRHGDEANFSYVLAEQELDIYEADGFRVNPGDVVLDCGAEYGAFTRKALSRGAKLVVAIEPSPDALPALERNLESEIASGRVVIYRKGVWDREQSLPMNNDSEENRRTSFVLGKPQDQAPIPLTTIDQIVNELRLERVDFIKMDIDGAEQKALRGARSTITRWKPRLSISLYHFPQDARAIPALIQATRSDYQYTKLCSCGVGEIEAEVGYFH